MCGICEILGLDATSFHSGATTSEGVTLTPLADAANFNQWFDWQRDTGLGALETEFAELRDKPVFGLTGDWDPNRPGDNNVIAQLDSGRRQDVSDGVITYGFYDHVHSVGLNNSPWFGEGWGYSPMTEEQREAARIAVGNWDDLISATFVEVDLQPGVSNWAKNTVDIWLANTWSGPAQAWAYYPGYDQPYSRVAGDVWIADPRYNSSNAALEPGFYGLHTLNHELGHSVGLSHPGTYDFGDDVDGDGEPDPITYTYDAQYFQDSNQYTIMSYFGSYETGAQPIDWNVLRYVYPSTPMVHDIAAVQAMYGADMTTRTGDSVYGFNASADVTNEAMRFETGDMATIFAIWDADGNDTIDLSGYYTPSVIDLREGAYSSAGGWGAYDPALLSIDPATIGAEAALEIINANNAAAGLGSRSLPEGHSLGEDYFYRLYFEGGVVHPTYGLLNEGLSWREITGTGDQYLMEQNIGIAYGAIIENAVGGHGNDRINGNQANNMFTGNAGADTFILADYSGVITRPDGDVTIVDTSVDQVMDFETGVDTLDLTEFGAELDFADLRIDTVGTTNTISFDRDGDGLTDFTFIVHGTVAEADFLFG